MFPVVPGRPAHMIRRARIERHSDAIEPTRTPLLKTHDGRFGKRNAKDMTIDRTVAVPANPCTETVADQKRLDQGGGVEPCKSSRPVTKRPQPVRDRRGVLGPPHFVIVAPSEGCGQPLAGPALKPERCQIGGIDTIDQHPLFCEVDQIKAGGEARQSGRIEQVEHHAAASTKIGSSSAAPALASAKLDTVTPTSRMPFWVGRTDRIRLSAARCSASRVATTIGWLRLRVIWWKSPYLTFTVTVPRACEASLARLGTDRLDLYLLHWRGNVPLGETVEAMERLVDAGKIHRWGVSNLDTDDMEELVARGGEACATDQILYNLTRRGPEHDLLPWLAEHAIPTMAYSPVEQGRLVGHAGLCSLADEIGATPAQLALAWLLARDNVIAIPKAGRVAHVRDNRAAADLTLNSSVLDRLDKLFPRPKGRVPLEML